MKPYFPLLKILPSITSRRVVQETYDINYQMHYTFSLRNCHSFNLSNYHEIRKKVSDKNIRFYKTVQKCEVCGIKLPRESSSYFFFMSEDFCTIPLRGVLWKGRKERVG